MQVRVACAIAAVMVAVALLTSSASGAPGVGTGTGPNTWTEIVLLLAGAGLGIWAIVRAEASWRLHWGTVSVVLFIAVTVLTALSIEWSVAPDQTWVEATRTAAYLAIFVGAAVLAALVPSQWQALASGIALATVALSVWALLVKIFDWPLDTQPEYGRLTAPFGYWNATGVVAAMGLPATVWATARRRRSAVLRGLAVPAIAILATVVVLSYSRSALLAAVLGLAVPLLLSDLKLRSLFKLILGLVGAAIMSVWALTNRNLSADSQLGASLLPHAARSSSDRDFGIVVLIVVIAFTVIGVATVRWSDGVQLTIAVRKRLHMLLAGLLALTPVLVLIGLALSSRGLGGEVSHIWDNLTQTQNGTTDSASRLTTVANSRPTYWHQALSIFDGHPLAGAGADTFYPALLRYPNAALSQIPTKRAHSYVFQTLADFGVIGALLTLALLLSWGRAVVRTFGRRGWPGQSRQAEHGPRLGLWGPEREGTLALLGTVVAFGTSSAIDWTWFFPGVAMPAMAAAGWMAGRGPLNRDVIRAPDPPRRSKPRPAAFAVAAVVAIVALVGAWYTLQPLRAQNAINASENALSDGDLRAALDDALDATHYQPEALASWTNLSTVYAAMGDRKQANQALVQGTSHQPGNPLSWQALGINELCANNYPAASAALTQAAERDVVTGDTTWTMLQVANAHTTPAGTC